MEKFSYRFCVGIQRTNGRIAIGRIAMEIPTQNAWLNEFIEAAEAAVVGYEKYLKDEINYNELAKIMNILRQYLPINYGSGMTGDFKETNDAAV